MNLRERDALRDAAPRRSGRADHGDWLVVALNHDLHAGLDVLEDCGPVVRVLAAGTRPAAA